MPDGKKKTKGKKKGKKPQSSSLAENVSPTNTSQGSHLTPSSPTASSIPTPVASSIPTPVASSTPTPVAASTPTPASSIKVTKDTIDGILKPQLNPQQDKLYEFCKNILLNYKAEFDNGTEDRTLFEIFIDIYQNYYPINNNMTDKEKNIFLNFLRVYNSPTHKRVSKPNIVKYFKTKTENQYADLLFKQKDMNSITEGHLYLYLDINDLGTTLLFKFVNQIAYEKTCLNEGRSFTHMNFIKVPGKNPSEKIEETLASTIFEEIVLWAISGRINPGGSKPICSIHCPKAGDILMDDGKSVEVKSTLDEGYAKRLFEKSQDKAPVGVRLSLGVHGRRCRPTAGQINVCLNAYELPLRHSSVGIQITKDFTTEEVRFETAFNFAINKCGIDSLTPTEKANLNVGNLLKKFYSTIVRYNTPSSSSRIISGAPASSVKVRLQSKTRGVPSTLIPTFMQPPQSMVSSTAKTQKLSMTRTASSTTKTRMGSAASKFTGVVIESFTHPKSGAPAGKLIRDSDGKEINFIGDFEENTKVKFRVRFETAIELEKISSPTVKGKSKKFKRRKSKKEKTKKK